MLGLFLCLWPDFDFGAIRWAGVLQRISVVFLVCALLFLNTNWKTQIKIATGILVAYVLLWRDECAVELGNLATALTYVNMVRIRARDGNRIMGLCTSYELNPGVAPVVDYTQEAANYDVQPCTAFTSADYARKAVHHELPLEFGIEGYRFYDLVRWGIAADVINNFITRNIGFRIFLRSLFRKRDKRINRKQQSKPCGFSFRISISSFDIQFQILNLQCKIVNLNSSLPPPNSARSLIER